MAAPCAKVSLFAINICMFAVGVAVLAGAGLLLGRHREYGALLGDGVFLLPLGLLLVGSAVVLLALLAWVGLLLKSSCLLYTYAGLLLVAVVVEVVLGTLLIIYRAKVERATQAAMKEVIKSYGSDAHLALTLSLDRAQQKLQCCGVLNYTEWENTTLGEGSCGVPESCCRTPAKDCGCQVFLPGPIANSSETVYTRGCYTTVRERLRRGEAAFLAVLVSFVLIKLLSVYFAFGVANVTRGRKVWPAR